MNSHAVAVGTNVPEAQAASTHVASGQSSYVIGSTLKGKQKLTEPSTDSATMSQRSNVVSVRQCRRRNMGHGCFVSTDGSMTYNVSMIVFMIGCVACEFFFC